MRHWVFLFSLHEVEIIYNYKLYIISKYFFKGEGLLNKRTYVKSRETLLKEMNQMIEASIFDEKAKQIYESHKEEWEKLYNRKIIAIDIDASDLVSVGEHIDDVDLEARRKRPGHRIFMRRVGKNPAVVRLRNRNYA